MYIINAIRDIIKTRMNLPDNRILQDNQSYNIPFDNDIHIVIGVLTEKLYANNINWEYKNNVMSEIQQAHKQTIFSLDILSKNINAVERRHEIILALSSTYAKKKQLAYGFKILKLTQGFSNISHVEGASRINRFNINFGVLNFVKLIDGVEYYDIFNPINPILTN
jgi:hypothetical protein